MSAWRSLHLYFDGPIYGAPADRILLDGVAPEMERARAEGSIDAFFFVRYFDGRSHLRLRWRAPSELTTSDDALAERLADLPLVTAVEWVPYEPEVERYGGPAGLAPSEELFFQSSRTALELLLKVPSEDRSARLGKGLLAQLVLLHAFLPHRPAASELVGRFGDAYIHQRTGDELQRRRWIEEYRQGLDRQSDHLAAYVEAAWSALDGGEPLTPELDTFRQRLSPIRDRLRTAAERGELIAGGAGSTTAASAPSPKLEPADWPKAIRWLLPSWLHMMHNRLGVDLREECYLAVLIRATLDSSDGDSSDGGRTQNSRSGRAGSTPPTLTQTPKNPKRSRP